MITKELEEERDNLYTAADAAIMTAAVAATVIGVVGSKRHDK